MKSYFVFSTVILAMFVAVGFQSCQSTKSATSSKLLKFNFEKGKGYDYNMVYDIDTKVDDVVSKVSIDGDYTMTIVDDNGAVKSLSTVYKKLRMDVDAGGMHMEMGSDVPTGGEEMDFKTNPMGAMSKIFGGLMNKPFIIKVDEEGNVLEVNGFEKILEGMIDSLPMDENVKKQSKASLKEQFNEQSIKDNFAQIFTIFPNKEVKVGDSWEKSYVTGGKMGAKFTTTYKVKEIEGDHVTLSTNSKITPSGTQGEVEGEQTGKILVDSKTGLMINATFDQDMKVKSEGNTVKIIGKGKISGKAL